MARRAVLWILPAALLAGGLVIAQRLAGPRALPLPSALPYIVRHPPARDPGLPAARAASNLGESVRALHARGITGRNVGIAIVDQALLTTHREYADRLRWYDEINMDGDPAGWHSTAVASITAGRTIGVAPEADLYFVGIGANWAHERIGNWFVAARRAIHNGMPVALAIRRILELNRRLEPGRRIRAISISVGAGPTLPGWDQTPAAIAEARAAGLFVSALDLKPVPFGPVTIASPAGPDRYASYRAAGSWAIAYWAGCYALACQQEPAITPERFRRQGTGPMASPLGHRQDLVQLARDLL